MLTQKCPTFFSLLQKFCNAQLLLLAKCDLKFKINIVDESVSAIDSKETTNKMELHLVLS